MSPALRSSAIDALLSGQPETLVAARHNLPIQSVKALAAVLKRQRGGVRPVKRRPIKAAGC
jgi:hypothetical protein